jgi:GT2 family glycosyltransferase
MHLGSCVSIEDSRTASISIIIPSCASPYSCRAVLKAIEQQETHPHEIVIIDSSGALNEEWDRTRRELSPSISGKLRIHRVATAMPGRARNLGIKLASSDWIGFLDVNTLPETGWLRDSLHKIAESGCSGSWGSTVFEAETGIAELLRDGIYGADANRTLPGSVIHKRAIEAVGQFIEWVRAAEDTEWISRALTLGIPVIDGPRSSIRYVGMARASLGDGMRKWRRNYLASHMLQHLHSQKVIAWLMLYAVLVTVAFNWNPIAAGWKTESPLYIDHITKIVSLAPLWTYAAIRGAWLPHRRGVPWSRLLPLRFLRIASVCLLLDGVKVMVFLLGRRGPEHNHDILV